MTNKDLVIYHNKDNDGYCSGTIAYMALINQGRHVDLLGWNYGDDVPKLDPTAYDHVYMVDITFPLSNLRELNSRFGKRLTIIDHHKSFIDAVMEDEFDELECELILNDDSAACELTWHYFNTKPVPLAVYAIAVMDIYRKDPDPIGPLRTFNHYKLVGAAMYARLGDIDNDESLGLWVERINYYNAECAIRDLELGEILQRGQKEKGKLLSASSVVVTIAGIPFNVMNSYGNKFITIKNGFPLLFFMHDMHGGIICSLIQNEYMGTEYCILNIAKGFGGGGHPNACGFSLPVDEFMMFLKNNIIS